MKQLLSNIGDYFYDQDEKASIENIKSELSQAVSKTMERVSSVLDRVDLWFEIQNLSDDGSDCEGTILCMSYNHKASCYANTATERQWRNQMDKVLSNAK